MDTFTTYAAATLGIALPLTALPLAGYLLYAVADLYMAWRRDYAERVRHEFERDFGKQPFKSAHGKTEPLQPHIAIDDVQACELGLVNLIVREK